MSASHHLQVTKQHNSATETNSTAKPHNCTVAFSPPTCEPGPPMLFITACIKACAVAVASGMAPAPPAAEDPVAEAAIGCWVSAEKSPDRGSCCNCWSCCSPPGTRSCRPPGTRSSTGLAACVSAAPWLLLPLPATPNERPKLTRSGLNWRVALAAPRAAPAAARLWCARLSALLAAPAAVAGLDPEPSGSP